MATLTITIPDANVPRVRVAFGHADPLTQAWVNATTAEVAAEVTDFVRKKTRAYEQLLAEQAARDAVQDAL